MARRTQKRYRVDESCDDSDDGTSDDSSDDGSDDSSDHSSDDGSSSASSHRRSERSTEPVRSRSRSWHRSKDGTHRRGRNWDRARDRTRDRSRNRTWDRSRDRDQNRRWDRTRNWSPDRRRDSSWDGDRDHNQGRSLKHSHHSNWDQCLGRSWDSDRAQSRNHDGDSSRNRDWERSRNPLRSQNDLARRCDNFRSPHNDDTRDDGNTVKTNSIITGLELKASLRSEEWMTNLAPYIELENELTADFSKPEWQDSKTSFTYLLLDPRTTDNLPVKQGSLTKLQSWKTFVNSIFYVGKGTRSRPYAHLKKAKDEWNNGSTTSDDIKTQHILDIWQDNLGVVCLHVFQNVIPEEAHTYEAAMIDFIGLSTLTNLLSGTYYGVAALWQPNVQRMLGLYLLYKAMQIFINEGEKQLGPDDI